MFLTKIKTLKMGWPLAILLVIIFICFSVILFLQFPIAVQYIEVYFLVVILILFFILIFTIDLSNPLSYTINFAGAKTKTIKVVNTPYNEDTTYKNIISATFAGTYFESGTANLDNVPVNKTATSPSNAQVFDLDAMNIGDTVNMLGSYSITNNVVSNPKIIIKKLAAHQLEITIDPSINIATGANTDTTPINGFFNLTLLCTNSQDIDGKFEEV